MGRPRKPPRDLTTDEAVRRLFPKRVVTRAQKEVHHADEKARKREENATKKKSKG